MAGGLTLCDLTQSYSETGGGIRTYLTEKRAFIDAYTPHRHVLIIPGKRDCIIDDGRHTTVHIASPRFPAYPNYRLLLRSCAVIKTLRAQRPTTVECLDAYNLPWAAMAYRRDAPGVSLIGGYRTDFPTAYVEKIARKILGGWAAKKLKRGAYKYAGGLYGRFDGVYALSASMAATLAKLGADNVEVLPLGADLDVFHPIKRDAAWRASLGAAPGDPILVYAGRIDQEKRADVVLDSFLQLPKSMNAFLVMAGEGNLKSALMKRAVGKRVHFPGFVKDRAALARILASSDIYVSAMPFETFGISIIEAQAAGLPVVGVASGAMTDRVPSELGVLGPPDVAAAMAANIAALWESGDARTMGERARAHVEARFSWRRTFMHLFGNIYPQATRLNFLDCWNPYRGGSNNIWSRTAAPMKQMRTGC